MSESGIVLIGLPGSGKTTLGQRVAERLGRLFIDTDAQVEHQTGRTPAQLIDEGGEEAFRSIERDVISRACTAQGAVIAAGGGSVLDPLNRWAFKGHGLRVRLNAPVELLERRLEATNVPRPLLGDALFDGIVRTRNEREPFYQARDVDVEATADVDTVAADVIEVAGSSGAVDLRWRMLYSAPFTRHSQQGREQGQLSMGVGITDLNLTAFVGSYAGGNPVVLADANATAANPGLNAALPRDRRCEIAGGEDAKTMSRLEEVLAWLTSIGAERTDPLVVAGGGTVGDTGGLAASLHRRGIPLVQVPTTWLAQADSSIGGKVAIDLPGAKNAIGAFWWPWLIVSDANLPHSLPIERRRDGIAECLKAGLIGDRALWALVEERGVAALSGEDPAAAYAMTERAARVKLAIVDRDPFDEGERRLLNLGHTLGHALEVESQYTLAHGEAVALGLRAVAAIADNRGAERDQCDRIDAVLSNLGFPLRRSFSADAVRQALRTDKKRRNGMQRWILPMAVGHVLEVGNVTDAELDHALSAIAT